MTLSVRRAGMILGIAGTMLFASGVHVLTLQPPGDPRGPAAVQPGFDREQSDRQTAADLYRKAVLLKPSQEKVDLLTSATAYDPANPNYAAALREAKDELETLRRQVEQRQ